METQIIEAAINIVQPVFERSIVLAAEYAKSCNRDCVTQKDVEYAMKYSVMRTVGESTGTLFPELEDSEDPDDIEVVDDAEETFTRYSGEDDLMNQINMCYDTWDMWKPESPIEKLLYDSVKKNS